MHVLLLILFTSLTMAAAAAGNRILLLYKRSILVSGVTGKLPGLCFVALFSMAQSCGAARISTISKMIMEPLASVVSCDEKGSSSSLFYQYY